MHVVRILTVYEFDDGLFDVADAPLAGERFDRTIQIDQSVSRERALELVGQALEKKRHASA